MLKRSVNNFASDSQPNKMIKVGYFRFHDNKFKPAYFGSTTGKSHKLIDPRRPFERAKTTNIDYECDSDAEWAEMEADDAESVNSNPDVLFYNFTIRNIIQIESINS